MTNKKVGVILLKKITTTSEEYHDLTDFLEELISDPNLELHISYEDQIITRYLSKQYFRKVVIYHLEDAIPKNPYEHSLKTGGISNAQIIDTIKASVNEVYFLPKK